MGTIPLPRRSPVTALDIPAYSLNYGSWRVNDRVWNLDQITHIRPKLAPSRRVSSGHCKDTA